VIASAPPYAAELVTIVDETAPKLLAIGDEASATRPAPGKWSPREIVGHLIDSASNNHQRFVRAQFQDALTFAGYDQDAWVAHQRYQDAPWPELVALWASFNRHLARVMASVPDGARRKPFARHNLHELAFRPLPANEPATLDYFMQDYVEHLKHHLRQIFGR
jgi:DinB superfamily